MCVRDSECVSVCEYLREREREWERDVEGLRKKVGGGVALDEEDNE